MMNIKMPQKDGFSIIELIIAGAISVTAIGVGFSLLQIALKGNKIDETQMGLNGRINDTLDFILDEVCLLYTSPSPRDGLLSRMPSSA